MEENHFSMSYTISVLILCAIFLIFMSVYTDYYSNLADEYEKIICSTKCKYPHNVDIKRTYLNNGVIICKCKYN